MAKFVSFDMIRTDFDKAMEGMGYVRIKKKCEEWGITQNQYAAFVRKGLIKNEDSFTVQNVKYISKNTVFEKGE